MENKHELSTWGLIQAGVFFLCLIWTAVSIAQYVVANKDCPAPCCVKGVE